MYKYYKQQMTIRDFLEEYYPNIDVQPVGQRLDTELTLESGSRETKAQGIIGSILRGIDLGQITMHEVWRDGFKYESIDGGHRKRYIKAFFNDEFRVDGKFYRDLTQEEKKMFLNTELTFCIYTSLKVWDIGYIFRSLNKTTDVNHQEMLNSYGNIPIANAVREMVRPVARVNNKYHSLFDFTERPGKPRNFINLQFDNKRLRIDEIVARIYYRYYDGGGLGRSDGMDEPVLNKIILAGYKLLNLETFFTSGPKESRAWTIRQNSLAPQAAGVIHTDFERGFIKAEVISYEDFIHCKGESGAKTDGKLRLEGKDYMVMDGDVIHFKFNV